LNELHDNIQIVLNAIKYIDYHWSLGGDLQVISIWECAENYQIKYCYLCLWDFNGACYCSAKHYEK